MRVLLSSSLLRVWFQSCWRFVMCEGLVGAVLTGVVKSRWSRASGSRVVAPFGVHCFGHLVCGSALLFLLGAVVLPGYRLLIRCGFVWLVFRFRSRIRSFVRGCVWSVLVSVLFVSFGFTVYGQLWSENERVLSIFPPQLLRERQHLLLLLRREFRPEPLRPAPLRRLRHLRRRRGGGAHHVVVFHGHPAPVGDHFAVEIAVAAAGGAVQGGAVGCELAAAVGGVAAETGCMVS
nr:hypothetical protein Iba_chr09aCG9710 [Ipomoea batatas]